MTKLILSTVIYCELLTFSVIFAYSKVSKNGQERSNSQDIAFTVAPVYVASQRPVELRPGEAVDHPSTPTYLVSGEGHKGKLDEFTGRQRVQDRFNPPANFEHLLSHSNGLRQASASPSSPLIGSASNDVVYSKPIVSMTYDYPTANFDVVSKPMSKPSMSSDSFAGFSPSKIPDVYSAGPGGDSPPSHLMQYESKPSSFELDHPPKSLSFPGHYDRPFDDLPSYAQEPFHHDEIIYDHIPDDDHFHQHFHHHRPPPSTEQPEMMDVRQSKRPYSYYYIGKKLWYIPLYFSIYFIVYIAALVLKSIARHKINFPASLAAVAAGAKDAHGTARFDDRDTQSWTEYITIVLDAIDKYRRTS